MELIKKKSLNDSVFGVMIKTKKIIAILIFLIVMSLFIPALMLKSHATVVDSGKCGANLTWTFDSDNTLTISGTGNMYDYTSSNSAPWQDNYKWKIKKLVLEEGITSIGNNAFSMQSSTAGQLVIPSTVTKIGETAFWKCAFTGNLTIPKNVKIISDSAFWGVDTLDGDLIIEDGVQTIGTWAFRGCKGLKKAVVPNSVTSIGSNAFADCENVKMYVKGGSVAHTYAQNENIPCEVEYIDISKATVNTISSYIYTGNPILPTITVSYDGKVLTKNKDYTVRGIDNTNVGTASVFIEGIGAYSNYLIKNFLINAASMSDVTVSDLSSVYEYTGTEIQPKPTIKLGNKLLYENTDYTISYKNNIESGIATITIVGENNLQGTINKTFEISDVNYIYNADVTELQSEYEYTGEPIEPVFEVIYKGIKLQDGIDYYVTYTDNISVGTGKIIIHGLGEYKESKEVEFSIIPKQINGNAEDGSLVIESSTSISDLNLMGDLYIPQGVTLTLNGTAIIKGNVYVFGSLENRASFTVTKTLNCLHYGSTMSAGDYNYGYFNNYGKVTINTLNVKDSYLSKSIPHVHNWNIGYVTKKPTCSNYGEKTFTCTLCNNTKTEIIEEYDNSNHKYYWYHTENMGKDGYDLLCSECGKNFGRGYKNTDGLFYIYNFIDNYARQHIVFDSTGKIVKTEKCSIANWYIDEDLHEAYCKCHLIICDDEEHKCKANITKATLSKVGNIVNKCTVCGYVKSTSAIAYPKTISLSQTSYTYNKKVQKPTVTVKDNNGGVIAASNYTVTYSNNSSKKAGEYKVTITFKGNYEGTKTFTYIINPKGTSLKKLTKGSKQFKATWKKQETETSGYELQYATNKNFTSGKKKVTIKKNKTTSSTVKKLKAKKKYYVRIRTYKLVNGKKFYSGWSKVLNVKTKK